MNTYVKWLLGTILVLLIAKVTLRPSEEPKINTPAEVEKPAPGQVQVPSRAKPPPTPVEKLAFKVRPAPTVKLPKKQIVKIDLSERTIHEMEYDWNILSSQAEAVRELRGWRFTRVSAESSFFRAGLREGDLITEDFLSALRGQDAAANLAYRIELILNRITR